MRETTAMPHGRGFILEVEAKKKKRNLGRRFGGTLWERK